MIHLLIQHSEFRTQTGAKTASFEQVIFTATTTLELIHCALGYKHIFVPAVYTSSESPVKHEKNVSSTRTTDDHVARANSTVTCSDSVKAAPPRFWVANYAVEDRTLALSWRKVSPPHMMLEARSTC